MDWTPDKYFIMKDWGINPYDPNDTFEGLRKLPHKELKRLSKALKEIGLDFKFVSRQPKSDELSYKDLNANALKFYPLIVNTTPLGTSPDVDTCPDLPYEDMTELNLTYDLVYNPEETLFMKRSAEHGAHVMNGKKMLLYQAERSWEIWNGLR